MIRTALVSGALLALVAGGIALATDPVGLSIKPLGQGILDPLKTKAEVGDWKVELKTKGRTNVTVVENTVAPGGQFGWHSHPGPSIVVVKEGTASFYRGDDPTCSATRYTAGQAYADPAGGLVHNVRNEGDVDLVVVVTRFLAPGVPSRQDAAHPGNNCPD